MRILIAVDSFKGSMRSLEAGEAVKRGITRVRPADITVKPVADGGEGTMDALVADSGGEYVRLCVQGPFGEPVTAAYGVLPGERTAVMEMAQAAGITLAPPGGLDPWRASTYGVGEMIRDAAEKGIRSFIIGIGGSATTDGGAGMLSALGYRFLDVTGKEIGLGAGRLDEISEIDDADVPEAVRQCHFSVACDVKNPLLGENGAVHVYGPQKGVKEDELAVFDRKLAHFAQKTVAFTGKDMRAAAGAGAAGGLGFAFLSYLDSRLKPGIQMVLQALDMEAEISRADLVITGEGRLDAQTAMGKVPVGIAELAKRHQKPVIAFAGGVTREAALCNEKGIDAFFPIVRGACPLEEAMRPEIAVRNMEDTAEQVFRLIDIYIR